MLWKMLNGIENLKYFQINYKLDNYDLISEWVEAYYKGIEKTSKLDNGTKFSYYKSLRGYFKHSSLLTDIKLNEFGLVDYRVWESILTKVKSSHNAVESGGVFMRFKLFEDICSERSYFSTKKKLLDLKLIGKTPFKDYYILNPLYVIKLYNPS